MNWKIQYERLIFRKFFESIKRKERIIRFKYKIVKCHVDFLRKYTISQLPPLQMHFKNIKNKKNVILTCNTINIYKLNLIICSLVLCMLFWCICVSFYKYPRWRETSKPPYHTRWHILIASLWSFRNSGRENETDYHICFQIIIFECDSDFVLFNTLFYGYNIYQLENESYRRQFHASHFPL